ncbi:hypothetical protein Agub_g9921, partial [Astrephomene gubernaculifera]
MFVLAHALGKQAHSLPPAERLAASLSSAGPSITLAACCEVAAFTLGGCLTGMPAVRNFSLAAAAALALDFGLQVTVFAALLVLDVRRMRAGRLDCCPCVRLGGGAAGVGEQRRQREGDVAGPHTPPAPAEAMEYGSKQPQQGDGGDEEDAAAPCTVATSSSEEGEEGEVDERSYWSLQRVLQAYFDRVHAPLLSRPVVQCGVLLLFAATLFASLAAIPYLQVGLDQAVALPRDSYLQRYYRDLLQQLRVGPPLLLVVRDLDLRPEAGQVERLCGVAGCAQDSLANRVSAAARDPASSFISASAASWLDDFMTWLSPDLPACCRTNEAGGVAASYCPPPDQPPCNGNSSACASCHTCVQAAFTGGRPSVPQFQTYLPWFLAARPSEQCAKAGVGAYSDALQRAQLDDPT